MRRSRARLEDVAERARVSKMTVSLCLRDDGGQGRLSQATRERVMTAVQELGYKPDLRARALRLGRTNVIAFYAGHGFVNVRNPFFTEIVSGLQEGCEITKKDLLLHSTFHTSKTDDIFGELLDGRIDGLVVNMPSTDPLIERLNVANLAIVAVADEIEDVPSILVDDAAGMVMIAEHLYEQGHRRVAFAGTPSQITSVQARVDTFKRATAALGMHCSIICPYAETDCWAVVHETIEAGTTAIACWNDDQARELLDYLISAGIDVPGTVAITGFDGCPTAYREARPLTTVAAPWSEVAKSAVLQLNARLLGEDVPPRIVLPVRFARGSTS